MGKSLGTNLWRTHSWIQGQSWIWIHLFFWTERCCNMTSLLLTRLLLLKIICCEVLASSSVQGGINDVSFAPCVVQPGLQAKGRLIIVQLANYICWNVTNLVTAFIAAQTRSHFHIKDKGFAHSSSGVINVKAFSSYPGLKSGLSNYQLF